MARSAQELFEEAMRLDPEERATLMRLLSASLGATQDSPVFVVPERTPAPAFTLPDLSGRTVSSKDLAGKVAVLSFGATAARVSSRVSRTSRRVSGLAAEPPPGPAVPAA